MQVRQVSHSFEVKRIRMSNGLYFAFAFTFRFLYGGSGAGVARARETDTRD
jgi:hypothetical protein